ncbi:MAG TPA: DUF3299 domain-containing protein [Gammaproteobacteria bacterium]|nr:DUF3299 domain-containing protein [Gammaproteobacteria bacterium]
MKLRYPFLVIVVVVPLAFTARAWWGKSDTRVSGPPQPLSELNWGQLVPEDFIPPPNPLASMTPEEVDKLLDGSEASNLRLAEMEAQLSYAPIVPQLDGLRVKIPGYVVPLEFDEQTELEEFLIVPYYGACIHTPPPPANQVIHANSEESIIIDNTYDPIWAIGVIKAETVRSDVAEAGYRLEIEQVLPYLP